MNLAKRILAAATAVPTPDTNIYVEDVFEIVVWIGDGVADRLIPTTNDLTDGTWLIWFRQRNDVMDNWMHTPGLSANAYVFLNSSSAKTTYTQRIKTLTATGFTVGSGSNVNGAGSEYVAWLFKASPKFFDVVFYTGNGANRSIAHNLESLPGAIWVKQVSAARDWAIYHRGMHATDPETDYMLGNSTGTATDDSTLWNDTAPTTTSFRVGTNALVNSNGGAYMALLFAHDDSSEGIIQCGQKVYDSGSNVALGWEPQFIIERRTDVSDDTNIYDVMRAFSQNSTRVLWGNNNTAESSVTAGTVAPLTKGFDENSDNAGTVMYVAIRRGLMRTPTNAEDVFDVVLYAGSSAIRTLASNWPVDMIWTVRRDISALSMNIGLRFREQYSIRSCVNELEIAPTPHILNRSTSTPWEFQDGVSIGVDESINASGSNYVMYQFRRARGFFDITIDVGTAAVKTVEHNLGAVPELMIRRSILSTSLQDRCYAVGYPAASFGFGSTAGTLSSSTTWNSTTPTSTAFTVGAQTNVNRAGNTFLTMLFASVPGVCKIGTYVSNGAARNLMHDFASTPRMLWIKCISTTTDGVLYDIERGIVAGNDPFSTSSSFALETSSDTIDPISGGITLLAGAANINVNARTYVYMMIA